MSLLFVLIIALLAAPGLGAFVGSRFRASPSTCFSLGILLLFGVFGSYAALSRYLSLPYGPVTGLILLIFSIAVGFVTPRWLELPPWARRETCLLPLFLVAGTTVVYLFVWRSGAANFAVIPNHDAINHAGWIGNIARQHSLSSVAAYSNPISGPGPASPLYPFAFHAVSALLVQVTGALPSTVMFQFTHATMCLLWPVSIYSVGRAIGLDHRIGAPAATVCTIPVFQFPAAIMGWGGAVMMLGVVVMIFAVAVLVRLKDLPTSRFAVLLLVSGTALLLLHTSEAFAIPMFVLVLGFPWRKSPQLAIVACSVAVAILFPWIDRWIGSGYISRLADVGPGGGGSVYQTLGLILNLNPGIEFHSLWIPVFVAGGFIAATYSTIHRNLTFLYVAVAVAVFAAAQADHAPWKILSFPLAPWYRQFQRLSYLLAPVVALLAGLLIEVLIKGVSSTRFISGPSLRRIGPVLTVSLLLFVTLTSWHRTARVQQILFGQYSTLTWGSVRVPDLVREASQSGYSVMSSFDSGIGYWGVNEGIRTWGAPQLSAEDSQIRDFVLSELPNIATNADLRSLIQREKIRYFATNNRAMAGGVLPSYDDMKRSGNFDVAWSTDTVTLWETRNFLSGMRGRVSGWFDAPDGQDARWAYDRESGIVITNLGLAPRNVMVKVRLYQNPCSTVRRIEVDGQQSIDIVGRAHADVTFTRRVPAGGTTVVPVVSWSGPCQDPATGERLRIGFSPVNVASD